MSPPEPARRYAVLVPVKRPAVAKSRLGGLGDAARRELAHAFAADTVASALACAMVARVLVVTDDHVLARALSDAGADVMPDGASDLNSTLVQAAAEMHRRDPAVRLAAVCADLPALRPEELARALDAAAPDRMSFVSDEERFGTTTVVAPTLEAFRGRRARDRRGRRTRPAAGRRRPIGPRRRAASGCRTPHGAGHHDAAAAAVLA